METSEAKDVNRSPSFSGKLPLEEMEETPKAKAEAIDFSSSLWRELPGDLLEMVLTRLPVPALKKFCQVSKEWRTLIESADFGRLCDSIESTLFYLEPRRINRDINTTSFKTDIWEKRPLDFVADGEGVQEFFAADGGLLCYRLLNFKSRYGSEVRLVVQNPLTRQWRGLIVPYRFENYRELVLSLRSMLGGLMVDQTTGTYQLVIGFVDVQLPRKAFIYDSSSNSWTTSTSLSPVLTPHFRNNKPMWNIGRSICCRGEIFWLVEETAVELPTRYFGPIDPCVYWPGSPLLYDNVEDLVRAKGPISHVKTLIKYSMKLDSWAVATQQHPCEELCSLHLASFENRPVMVNFCDSVKCTLFPPEFSSLLPEMERLDAENVALLLKEVGGNLSPHGLKPKKAFAEGGTWFVVTESSTGLSSSVEKSVEIFAFTKSPSTVRRLPRLDMTRNAIGAFAYLTPSLKAVV